jgi:hypothetical protein
MEIEIPFESRSSMPREAARSEDRSALKRKARHAKDQLPSLFSA